jgi:hypothetical protein
MVRMHARRTAQTKDMDNARRSVKNAGCVLDDVVPSPCPHRLINANGKYTVHRVRHSSALRVPAEAAPYIGGTLFNQDGVTVSLMTARIR